ncbi:MAG: hypothetical protein EOM24_13365, partial [Chloroflexia bacterium]|nr:hypothetical protein [Chloroflexia bacterium]
HTTTVSALAVSADGTTLLSGDNSGSVRMWDLRSPEPNTTGRELDNVEAYIRELAISTDQQTIFVVHTNGLLIHDLSTSEVNASTTMIRVGGNSELVALSPAYTMFAVGYSNGTIELWNLTIANPAAATLLLEGHSSNLTGLAFIDDQRLVSASLDGMLRIWDVSVPDPTASVLITGQEEVGALSLSRDGSTLATIGSTRSGMQLRLFDLRNPFPGNSARTITSNNGEVPLITLSPDGRSVAATGGVYARALNTPGVDYYAIHVWSLDPVDLIAPACRAVGRNFSSLEWQQFFSNAPYRKTCPQEPVP